MAAEPLALDVTALACLVENAKVDAPMALSNLSRWLVARRELILAALERIPELERQLDEAHDQNMRQAARLERVAAAAREAAFCRRPEPVRDNRAPEGWSTTNCGECTGCKLIAALADAPAEARQSELTNAERGELPILTTAAWDVVEDINRCIRSGEPPDLRTIRWWGGHLAVAREAMLDELKRAAAPAEEGDGGR